MILHIINITRNLQYKSGILFACKSNRMPGFIQIHKKMEVKYVHDTNKDYKY